MSNAWEGAERPDRAREEDSGAVETAPPRPSEAPPPEPAAGEPAAGEAAAGEAAATGEPAAGEAVSATAGGLWGPPLRLYIAGLSAAAVLLAVATGLLAAAQRASSDAGQQRSAVLLAARQEAVSLTNLNQQAGSRDFDAVLAGSAGSLREQLVAGRGAFLKALSASDVTSAGTVLDAGIVSMTSSSATVLLNVKATVRNKQTYAPETRLYHWQAALVYSGGRWLMTSLEFT